MSLSTVAASRIAAPPAPPRPAANTKVNDHDADDLPGAAAAAASKALPATGTGTQVDMIA